MQHFRLFYHGTLGSMFVISIAYSYSERIDTLISVCFLLLIILYITKNIFRRSLFLLQAYHYLEGIKDVPSECSELVRTVGLCAQTWWSWRCIPSAEAQSASCSRATSPLTSQMAGQPVLYHTCFDSPIVLTFSLCSNVAIAHRLSIHIQLQFACSDGCGLSLRVRNSIRLHLRMRI